MSMYHTYIYMYICMYLYIYVYMIICMYTCIHTHDPGTSPTLKTHFLICNHPLFFTVLSLCPSLPSPPFSPAFSHMPRENTQYFLFHAHALSSLKWFRYTRTGIYLCVYIYTCMYIHKRVCMCVCVCVPAYMYIYKYACLHSSTSNH